ncbi:translesion DNA synthesis-associated protein ImuA [Ketobacter sp.]|uniref:translesion DNA synthesis-associated protein ImuA n=1 Tax=Ketobacter sp. TaxID=2083498 RepID=UPI0025C31FF6|nr:translesion DNA synthesis-associated protein ImuA [Ketobacter sp.]
MSAAAKPQLNRILQHPAIWRAADGVRGQNGQQQQIVTVATGFPTLDRALPDGGLPCDSVAEILCPQWGCGETELVSSALTSLSQQSRWLVWVNPPWLPYAPALMQQGIALENTLVIHSRQDKQILWAMEQCLSSGACSAVQGWPHKPTPQQIRRLQLAAQKGNSLCLLMRPQAHIQQPSPAPLRLEMGPLQQAIQVRVVKCRGHWGSPWLRLPRKAMHQATVDAAALGTVQKHGPDSHHSQAIAPTAAPVTSGAYTLSSPGG